MYSVIIRNETRNCDLQWRSIRINKSLDEICHTLEAELSPSELSKVRRHDRLAVRYKNPVVRDSRGARRITTVRVDEITAFVDNEKHNIKIMGRSPARDIIDSTWSKMLKDNTLRGIVQQIGDEFGIECESFPKDPDPTETVYDFGWNDESPWTKLIAEADTQHFILTSNEAGNLYLWKVQGGLREEPFAITEGVNVLTAEWKENGAEQFHEYTVTGGGGISTTVIDESCPTKRKLLINVPHPLISQAELDARAQTEMRRRKEIEITVKVPGWGLTNAQIQAMGETNGKEIFWIPNIMTPVDIKSLGVKRTLLISAVNHEVSLDGMSTTVTLVNRDKYL